MTNAWSIGQFAIADIAIEAGHALSRRASSRAIGVKAMAVSAISLVVVGGDGRDLHASTAQLRRDHQLYRLRLSHPDP